MQDNKFVDEFLQAVNSIVEKLALAQALVIDEDLVIVILNGLIVRKLDYYLIV